MSTDAGSRRARLTPRETKTSVDNGEFQKIGGWRSGRDSNPRYGFAVYSLSRRAPSTTRPPLRTASDRSMQSIAPESGAQSKRLERGHVEVLGRSGKLAAAPRPPLWPGHGAAFRSSTFGRRD